MLLFCTSTHHIFSFIHVRYYKKATCDVLLSLNRGKLSNGSYRSWFAFPRERIDSTTRNDNQEEQHGYRNHDPGSGAPRRRGCNVCRG